MNVSPSSVLIFTDGACKGNPGPGGWGSIIARPDGTVNEMGGGSPETTNNRMEMAAAIHALASLEPGAVEEIVLYTDSSYLIKGITQWVWGWRSRGWKTADGKEVANRQHWEELVRHVTRLKPAKVDWRYVRGHSGFPGNERCDVIAVSYSEGKPERLYQGPIDGYFVDLTELPQQDVLPEQKSANGAGRKTAGGGSAASCKSGGGGPVTYLSYLNGIVKRYFTWSECEKRVKGQPNARFKKARSPQEERETLKSWGLSPDTPIE